MLTDDQMHHFRVFGFIVLRQAFNMEEIAKLGRLADEIWTAELGHPPIEEEHVSIAPFLELHPETIGLIEDDRIYTPMVQLLGQDMIWSGSEGVQGTMTRRPYHHWHADRPGSQELGYLRIKIMMYLDPMRKDAGAFRVIPGSHRSPFHEELAPFQQRHGLDEPAFFGYPGSEVPCYPVETDPGGRGGLQSEPLPRRLRKGRAEALHRPEVRGPSHHGRPPGVHQPFQSLCPGAPRADGPVCQPAHTGHDGGGWATSERGLKRCKVQAPANSKRGAQAL